MLHLKSRCLGIVLFIIGCSLASFASATTKDLEAKAVTVFNQVEMELKRLKANNQLQTEPLKAMVYVTLLPHIDRKYFAFKVLGKHLEKLSSEQKVEFVELLTIELVGNYAESLKRYNNETFGVTSSTLAPSGKLATVNMKFSGQGKPISAITKWRFSEKDGSWAIYDFVLEGISLLQTKQKEMSSQILATGLEGALQKLQSKVKKED